MLTDEERAQISACLVPEARTALLLEWVLIELRAGRTISQTEFPSDTILPPAKRGPGRPRTNLGGAR